MDSKEIEQLIDEYGPILFRFCLSLTKNQYEGEELYQDTFLRLLTLQQKIDQESNVKGFLLTVASRLWKDKKRKFARRFRIAPTVSENELFMDVLAPKDVEKEVEENLLKKDINESLLQLEETHREVLLLQYMGGLSIQEISQNLSVPEGTVKSRSYYGKEKLRVLMEGKGYGPK